MDVVKFSSGAAEGSSGNATAVGFSVPLSGLIHKVRLEYSGSPPATTDVTLIDESDAGAESILNRMNASSNTTIYPRRAVQTNSGSNCTYDGVRIVYENFAVNGRLKLTISQTNPACECTAYVYVIRI
ncbi:MAG: hypothetical protein ACPL4H_03675 [Anaerolineales bacterium]